MVSLNTGFVLLDLADDLLYRYARFAQECEEGRNGDAKGE